MRARLRDQPVLCKNLLSRRSERPCGKRLERASRVTHLEGVAGCVFTDVLGLLRLILLRAVLSWFHKQLLDSSSWKARFNPRAGDDR